VYHAVLEGRPPVDVEGHNKVAKAIIGNKDKNKSIFDTDWFIDDRSRRDTLHGQTVLLSNAQRVSRIIESISKVKRK